MQSEKLERVKISRFALERELCHTHILFHNSQTKRYIKVTHRRINNELYFIISIRLVVTTFNKPRMIHQCHN